jgi:hypothetical protein
MRELYPHLGSWTDARNTAILSKESTSAYAFLKAETQLLTVLSTVSITLSSLPSQLALKRAADVRPLVAGQLPGPGKHLHRGGRLTREAPAVLHGCRQYGRTNHHDSGAGITNLSKNTNKTPDNFLLRNSRAIHQFVYIP